MRARFNQSFKLQVVEKALGREPVISLSNIAKSLGVGHLTLRKLICKSRSQTLHQAVMHFGVEPANQNKGSPLYVM
jgi:transposase-like protein